MEMKLTEEMFADIPTLISTINVLADEVMIAMNSPYKLTLIHTGFTSVSYDDPNPHLVTGQFYLDYKGINQNAQ